VFAAITVGFFVAGQVNERSAATQSAPADSATELSFADSDVTASRADLDAALDTLLADSTAGGDCDGQRDGLLDEAWSDTTHCISPTILPRFQNRRQRRAPK